MDVEGAGMDDRDFSGRLRKVLVYALYAVVIVGVLVLAIVLLDVGVRLFADRFQDTSGTAVLNTRVIYDFLLHLRVSETQGLFLFGLIVLVGALLVLARDTDRTVGLIRGGVYLVFILAVGWAFYQFL